MWDESHYTSRIKRNGSKERESGAQLHFMKISEDAKVYVEVPSRSEWTLGDLQANCCVVWGDE